MSHNPEIPCASCHRWSTGEKNFSCDPNKCSKLNEWLLDHAQLPATEHEQQQIIEPALQYVV